MSKKTLNKANLEKLGAEKLAELVIDLVQGSAALQRRARLELSAAQGPKDVAADIRKRFASLRRSSSFVDWSKQRALVKDLKGLLAMIETTIAPQDADEAFELLWSFLQLAPRLHERTDDSNGAVGDVMREAVDIISQLSSRISVSPKTLAERILDAVARADYGEFDGIIPSMADALGQEGLEHLKQITDAWAAAPPAEHELARYRGIGLSSAPSDSVQRHRQSTRSIILADIADAQGDVDAYMARYSAEQLTYGTIAPDVARRLLDAGRTEEAFDIVSRARTTEDGKPLRMFRHDLDEVYEESRVIPGKGVSAEIEGQRLTIASPRFATEAGVPGDNWTQRATALKDVGKTVAVLFSGESVLGLIALRDEPRTNAGMAVAQLRRLGIVPTILTGDNPRTAAAIAGGLGTEFRAEMLPEDKLAAIRELAAKGGVMMVGDGINDAPALKQATVGIAMGSGTDVALETADGAILRDRVTDVPATIRLARAAMRNIRQNIIIALGLKAVFLVTSVLGLTGLWIAILADTGATVLVTLNALRLLAHDPARG